MSNTPRATIAACPVCGKATKAPTRPFCSKRCADVDLNRWLGEQYRLPTAEPPSFDSEPETAD
jgi:endogenous inhibitor of DNA gyrase (YacG/DUF329 family)